MAAPWTRIEHTELWNEAREAYNANGLPYHGFGHVLALYGWAERLSLPYSAQLDECILAHDVVMGLGPGHNERASANWLVSRGRSELWAAPILDTIDHRPSKDGSRLAMLDLMDFADPSASRRNTEMLRREAMQIAKGDFDQKSWMKGTMGYLSGLSERILADLQPLEAQDWVRWSSIARGIAVTMSCAPHVYDPHPASGIRRFTRGAEAMAHVLASQEAPMSLGEFTNLGDPWMPEGSASVRAMTQLMEEGLAEWLHPKGSDPVWGLTDEGREWVAKMNAPDQDYPEPTFP